MGFGRMIVVGLLARTSEHLLAVGLGLERIYFRWFENTVIDIPTTPSIPLILNHVNYTVT